MPSTARKKKTTKVIFDSESPPIQLSEKLRVDGFYLAQEMRMPIYEKDTVVGLSRDMLTDKDHHGEKSRTYRASVIVIWPKSRRHKVLDSMLEYNSPYRPRANAEYLSEEEDGGIVLADGCYNPSDYDTFGSAEGDYWVAHRRLRSLMIYLIKTTS